MKMPYQLKLTEDCPDPCIRWDNGYKVTILGEPGVTFPLPGKKHGDGHYDHVIGEGNVVNNTDTIVFGTCGSGTRDFQRWWCGVLDKKELNWLAIDGRDWESNAFKRGKTWRQGTQKTLDDDTNKANNEKVLEQLKDPDQSFNFISWTKKLTEDFFLIIRNLSGLKKRSALSVATTFRKIRDRNTCPYLHVLIIDSSDSVLMGSEDISGYLWFCNQYRLPFLNCLEIQYLATHASLTLPEEALDKFLDHTGGQPLLVRLLLNKLKALADNEDILPPHLDQAALRLRDAPPRKVYVWKKSLAGILNENPALINRMSAFISGTTYGPARFPIRDKDRPLFITGWLKLNKEQRWGISSSLHNQYAWEVITELKRGIRP